MTICKKKGCKELLQNWWAQITPYCLEHDREYEEWLTCEKVLEKYWVQGEL